ncbi:hypothetical protein ACKQTC_04795 [Peptococcus simiae]|uniref:Uncharacterized protein n=1 Tax=Peptococcus simiae TaxID=1643805 RepID=A0ABW9H0J3_9FIRM
MIGGKEDEAEYMWHILIETILGGLTGFVTNDIAVRQLFRPGGIIEKERDGFIHMITEVLEKDIFSPEVMADLAAKPETIAVFQALAAHLRREVLPVILADERLDDGDEGQILRTLTLCRLERASWMPVRLAPGFIGRRLDAVNEGPQGYAGVVHRSLTRLGRETPDALILGALLPADDLAEKWDRDQMTQFLSGHRRLITEELQRLLAAFCETAAWQEKSLAALVGQRPEEGAKYLAEKVVHIFNDMQDKAREVTEPADRDGVMMALDGFLQGRLENIWDSVVPDLWPAGMEILQHERPALEKALLSAVSETLGDSSLKGPVLRAMKSYFAGSKGNNWLTHLFIEWQKEEKQAGLKEGLIGQVMDRVSLSQPSKEEDFRRDIQEEPLSSFLSSLIEDKLTGLLARTPAQLVQDTLGPDRLVHWLYEALYYMVDKTEMPAKLAGFEAAWRQKPLAETVLTVDRTARLSRLSATYLEEKDWSPVLGRLEGLSPQPLIMKGADRFLHLPLTEMWTVLDRETTMSQRLEEALTGRISANVFGGMAAHLGSLARDQLNQLSHNDMRQLALDLLGREMRPLSAIGGVVGGAVGLASGSAMTLAGLQAPSFEESELLFSAAFAGRCAMYGAVGYGTNVLAVQGLFKPYSKTLGWQGLLPKNQHRFAEKMHELTQQYVINEEIWAGVQEGLAIQAQKPAWDHFAPLMTEMRLGGAAFFTEALDRVAGRYTLAQGLTQLTPTDLDFLISAGFHHRPEGSVAAKLVASLPAAGLKALEAGQDWAAFSEGPLLDLLENTARGVTGKLLAQRPEAIAFQLDQWAGNLQLPAEGHGLYSRLAEGMMLAYDRLPDQVKPHTGRLAKRLSKRIRRHLPMSVDFLFSLMNGEGLIREVIKKFLSKQLPAYLADRRDYYQAELTGLLEKTLAGRTPYALGIRFNDPQTVGQLAILWPTVKKAIEGTDLRRWLVNHRYFFPDPGVLMDRLPAILAKWGEADSPVLSWVSKRLDRVYANANPAKKEALLGLVRRFLASAPVQVLCDLSIQDILAPQVWANYRDTLVALLTDLSDRGLDKAIRGRVEGLFAKAWDQLVPLFASYGQLLIAVLQLPRVAQREILQLSPARLETMVRAIANPYFRHVERMGALGAVVAVPATLLAQALQ